MIRLMAEQNITNSVNIVTSGNADFSSIRSDPEEWINGNYDRGTEAFIHSTSSVSEPSHLMNPKVQSDDLSTQFTDDSIYPSSSNCSDTTITQISNLPLKEALPDQPERLASPVSNEGILTQEVAAADIRSVLEELFNLEPVPYPLGLQSTLTVINRDRSSSFTPLGGKPSNYDRKDLNHVILHLANDYILPDDISDKNRYTDLLSSILRGIITARNAHTLWFQFYSTCERYLSSHLNRSANLHVPFSGALNCDQVANDTNSDEISNQNTEDIDSPPISPSGDNDDSTVIDQLATVDNVYEGAFSIGEIVLGFNSEDRALEERVEILIRTLITVSHSLACSENIEDDSRLQQFTADLLTRLRDAEVAERDTAAYRMNTGYVMNQLTPIINAYVNEFSIAVIVRDFNSENKTPEERQELFIRAFIAIGHSLARSERIEDHTRLQQFITDLLTCLREGKIIQRRNAEIATSRIRTNRFVEQHICNAEVSIQTCETVQSNILKKNYYTGAWGSYSATADGQDNGIYDIQVLDRPEYRQVRKPDARIVRGHLRTLEPVGQLDSGRTCHLVPIPTLPIAYVQPTIRELDRDEVSSYDEASLLWESAEDEDEVESHSRELAEIEERQRRSNSRQLRRRTRYGHLQTPGRRLGSSSEDRSPRRRGSVSSRQSTDNRPRRNESDRNRHNYRSY